MRTVRGCACECENACVSRLMHETRQVCMHMCTHVHVHVKCSMRNASSVNLCVRVLTPYVDACAAKRVLCVCGLHTHCCGNALLVSSSVYLLLGKFWNSVLTSACACVAKENMRWSMRRGIASLLAGDGCMCVFGSGMADCVRGHSLIDTLKCSWFVL